MTVTNLEFHFHIAEQVWGKGAPIAPNAFRATIEHMVEEYLEKDQNYKNVDDWLAAWNVWLQAERTDEPVQS